MKPLFATFLFFTGSLVAQPALQQKAMILKRVIEKNHFSPKQLNDEFSASVFDHMIEELDEYKLYFTRQDIESLGEWRLTIDDEVNGKSWGFIDKLAETWEASQANAAAICKQLALQPVNLANTGEFSYNNKTPYAADGEALKARWSKYLQYKIAGHLFDSHKKDSIKPTIASLQKEEPAARKKLAASMEAKLLKKQAETGAVKARLEQLYLNSIATYYDPHTEFFPPDEKKSFDEQLSSQRMKYGFAIAEDDGEYTITALMPGSPAWNCGSIHINDKVVRIKTIGGTEIEMDQATDHEMEQAFGSDNMEMEITVQSADGKESTVKLRKELLQNSENFVKGYILIHGDKKTGYISLPSFYTGWGDEGGSSCANDLSKEIVKLKREGIDALLLDLRYNGGGSLQESLELSGIFIDAGPLALVKDKSGKTGILKDPSRGTIYDGPLGVMINGQSASASELVAGALQDYHRAIIIGGNSFGKATMQEVIPADSNFNAEQLFAAPGLNEKNGFVKITAGKLYRINGNTNQLKGVKPDIVLPDAIEAFDYSESKMPFALPADTTMKKVVYTLLKPLPVETLAQQSSGRVAGSPYFAGIKKYIQSLKAFQQSKSIPIQWEAFNKWEAETGIDSVFKKNIPTTFYTVANSALDTQVMQLDAYQKEMSEKIKNDILRDAYIEEAVRVMADLVQLSK